MIEPARAIAWTIATLKASATFMAAVPGGIHEGVAPAGTAYPHCVVNMQSPGNDLMVVGSYRLWAEPLIQVAVWGLAENGWTDLITAADAADTALQRGSGTTTDAEIINSVREQPVMRPVLEDGTLYSVLGGMYRQITHALP